MEILRRKSRNQVNNNQINQNRTQNNTQQSSTTVTNEGSGDEFVLFKGVMQKIAMVVASVGIGEDEKKEDEIEPLPVFGEPLEKTLIVENGKMTELPLIVIDTITAILDMKAYLEEGLFRLSSSHQAMMAAKTRYNNHERINFLSDVTMDPHLPACLLKLFIRELPESIFTAELLQDFNSVFNVKDPLQRFTMTTDLINKLPRPNYCVLRELFALLQVVNHYSHKNKMNDKNLAIIFVPALGIGSAELFKLILMEQKLFFNGDTITSLHPAGQLSFFEVPHPSLNDWAADEALSKNLERTQRRGQKTPKTPRTLQRSATKIIPDLNIATPPNEISSTSKPTNPLPNTDRGLSQRRRDFAKRSVTLFSPNDVLNTDSVELLENNNEYFNKPIRNKRQTNYYKTNNPPFANEVDLSNNNDFTVHFEEDLRNLLAIEFSDEEEDTEYTGPTQEDLQSLLEDE